jgi:hypothetical protein
MTDYTINAIRSQLLAMNCDYYKLGIFNRHAKKMTLRYKLDFDSIFTSVQWLKFNNANGHDIYITQNNNLDRALILVDDLKIDQIKQMDKRGVNPACVIETSPDNYQVWVSLGLEPMPKNQRKILATLLAKTFGGDPASVDANHFGRLAGFTNRKPEYQKESGYPFVLCREATGKHAEKKDEIRAWVKAKADEEMFAVQSKQNFELIPINHNNYQLDIGNVFNLYFKQWLHSVKKNNKAIDYSSGDFAVTSRMINDGYTKSDIISAIENYSPNIKTRKRNHIEDYALRTFNAALKRILSPKQ